MTNFDFDFLKGKSVQQLKQISEVSAKMAEDLKAVLPSYDLAIFAGVQDCSYDTQSNGWVRCYRGEALIKMDDGRVFRAVGHGPDGDAWSIYRQGYIEFIPIRN